MDFLDSGGAGDVVGGGTGVSGEHGQAEAETVEGADRSGGGGTECVFGSEPPGILAVHCDMKQGGGGWAIAGSCDAEFVEEGAVSGGYGVVVDDSGDALAGDGLDVRRGLS